MDALKSVDANTIQKVAEYKRIDIRDSRNEKRAASKKVVLNRIDEAAQETGMKQIISMFKLTQLEDVKENMDIQFKDTNNPHHKPVLQKRIYEVAADEGIERFLEMHDKTVLKHFCGALGISPKSSVKATREMLTAEIYDIGVTIFLTGINTPVLREVGEQLFGEDALSWNKKTLVDAIASGREPEQKKRVSRKKRSTKFSRTKKPIRKGITYQDIFQHYKVSELVDWLRKRKQVHSGKKSVLIKSILSYLEMTPAEKRRSRSPSPKRRKKKSVTPKKKSPKKKSPKKKKSVTPKKQEEEVEEQVEDDEEEEEQEVEDDEEEQEQEEMVEEGDDMVEASGEDESGEDSGEETSEGDEYDFPNMVVCVTGTLPMKRSAFVKLIEAKGSTFSKTITKKVTHLVCAVDKPTAKVQQAKKDGIPIIPPSVFTDEK